MQKRKLNLRWALVLGMMCLAVLCLAYQSIHVSGGQVLSDNTPSWNNERNIYWEVFKNDGQPGTSLGSSLSGNGWWAIPGNGGGTTANILVFPPSGTSGDFRVAWYVNEGGGTTVHWKATFTVTNP